METIRFDFLERILTMSTSRIKRSMSKSPKIFPVIKTKISPEFKPNLTPKQVLQLGSFGNYLRDIQLLNG